MMTDLTAGHLCALEDMRHYILNYPHDITAPLMLSFEDVLSNYALMDPDPETEHVHGREITELYELLSEHYRGEL